MAAENHRNAPLGHADRRLMSLLTSVLVDPNLHTDARMRLHEQISEILDAAQHQQRPRAPKSHAASAQLSATPAAPLPDLLARVLVDPNLHTDTRMRLRQEIGEILAAAHAHQEPRGTSCDVPVPMPTS